MLTEGDPRGRLLVGGRARPEPTGQGATKALVRTRQYATCYSLAAAPATSPMRSFALPLLLLLPWLNPFAGGPSAAVIPWLVSLGCASVFVLLVADRRVDAPQVAATSWLCAAVISSLMAMLQYFDATAAFSPWINGTQVGEAFANLRQRNQFATLTNIGLVALLWWATRRNGSAAQRLAQASDNLGEARLAPGATDMLPTLSGMPTAPWIAMAWSVPAAALLAIGNAASSSRTGMVQLLLLCLLYLFWGGLRDATVRRLLLAAVLAYCAAAYALPRLAGLDPANAGIMARIHEGAPACFSRVTLWGNVLHLIAQKPWTGWGWGELDYAHFMTLYPGARFCDILDNAHNLPLHMAVELGLPVAVPLCALLLWQLWHAKPWQETDLARRMAWAVLALIGLHSMLEYPLWYGPFQIAAVLCCWLLWRPGQPMPVAADDMAPKSGRPAASAAGQARIPLLACALAAMLWVGYALWDYHRISQIYLDPEARSSAYSENTLDHVRRSRLYREHVLFAELTTTQVTPDNAQRVHELAAELLHFSPEARVAEKLIDSARLLGREEQAHAIMERYRAAFPAEYALWAKEKSTPAASASAGLP